jgi:pilus assembly protein CpaE
MTTIVEQDPVLAEVFRSGLDGRASVLSSLDDIDEHLRRHPDDLVVVLGPSVRSEAAAEFGRRNRISRPALGVILVRPTVDHVVLADALRSGMSEVVETSDSSGLRDAVRRAEDLSRAMAEGLEQPTDGGRAGLLVTVFSTKGGVGKSFLATNLGAALADQGRRVCIVDLDVNCGDVAIMLQLTPLHSLADLSQLSGGIDTSGVESLLTEHSEGLSVLAAPVQLGSPVPAEPIGSLLETLKGMFDVVVVDTSGVFDDYVLPALDTSDQLVLVGTLDIPALKSLKLAVGTLDLLNLPRERWRFVLNRADSKVGLSAGEFEETLGLEADITLPTSRDVLTAVNRGDVIVRSSKGHPISKTLVAFAQSLAHQPEAPGTGTDTPSRPSHARRGGPRRGLLSRKGA